MMTTTNENHCVIGMATCCPQAQQSPKWREWTIFSPKWCERTIYIKFSWSHPGKSVQSQKPFRNRAPNRHWTCCKISQVLRTTGTMNKTFWWTDEETWLISTALCKPSRRKEPRKWRESTWYAKWTTHNERRLPWGDRGILVRRLLQAAVSVCNI